MLRSVLINLFGRQFIDDVCGKAEHVLLEEIWKLLSSLSQLLFSSRSWVTLQYFQLVSVRLQSLSQCSLLSLLLFHSLLQIVYPIKIYLTSRLTSELFDFILFLSNECLQLFYFLFCSHEIKLRVIVSWHQKVFGNDAVVAMRQIASLPVEAWKPSWIRFVWFWRRHINAVLSE